MNFVIIGCGNIAQRHALEATNHGNLLAVCDINEEKAKQLAQKFNCKNYTSLDELLANEKEVDVASICTPNWLHAPQSIQCLQNGLNVLCEKPMAITATDAMAMTEAAAQSGKKLFIVKQNRYNPLARYVKQLIDNQQLGKIYSFTANCFWNRSASYYQDWRGKKDLDGGSLYTQFSHYIDLIVWFWGEVKSASLLAANMNHPYIEFEDTGVVQLVMQNGVVGSINYTVNAFHKNMESSIAIFGERGTIKIGGQYLNNIEYFCVDGITAPQIPVEQGPNEYGFYQGSLSTHDKVYKNLVEALSLPGHEMLEGEEGVKTVKAIELIYNNKVSL
ncbi:MAG: Gfo/Idh/MocA family oxidoreductase [Niabella sp.]